MGELDFPNRFVGSLPGRPPDCLLSGDACVRFCHSSETRGLGWKMRGSGVGAGDGEQPTFTDRQKGGCWTDEIQK